MGLSRDEVKRLLAMVAVLDDRETDDPVLTSAWCEMAEEGRWESLAAAKRALRVYRTEQPNYTLRPGHITQVLERVRRQASAALARQPDPALPQAALDDPLEYQRFMHAHAAEFHRRWMAEFAAGGDPAAAQSALEAARVPQPRAVETGGARRPRSVES